MKQARSASLSRRGRCGFTLVELIVVLALLAVLMMLASTFGNSSMEMIRQVGSRSSSDRMAAMTFEQIARDLDEQVVRRERTMRVIKNGSRNDDELVLITRRRGLPAKASAADRRVSTAHYRVTDHALMQGADGFRFGDPEAPPSREAGTLELYDLPVEGPGALDESSFRPLVDGVLRMEFSFIVGGSGGTPEIVADFPPPPARVDALVVTIVVLDPERSRMIDDQQRTRIAAEFPDAKDGELPGDGWTETARGLASNADSVQVPAVALRNVRVYQRRLQLPNSGTP